MKPIRLFFLGLFANRALPGEYGALSYRLGCSIGEGIYLSLPFIACFGIGVFIGWFWRQ